MRAALALALLLLAHPARALVLRYTFDQTSGCDRIVFWNVQIDGAWSGSLPSGPDCGLGVVRNLGVALTVGDHTTAIAAVYDNGAAQTGWSNVVTVTVASGTTTTVPTTTSSTSTTPTSTTTTTPTIPIPAPSNLIVGPRP